MKNVVPIQDYEEFIRSSHNQSDESEPTPEEYDKEALKAMKTVMGTLYLSLYL
jgi:hypothetical protein